MAYLVTNKPFIRPRRTIFAEWVPLKVHIKTKPRSLGESGGERR